MLVEEKGGKLVEHSDLETEAVLVMMMVSPKAKQSAVGSGLLLVNGLEVAMGQQLGTGHNNFHKFDHKDAHLDMLDRSLCYNIQLNGDRRLTHQYMQKVPELE
jgi:hypothetical protein